MDREPHDHDDVPHLQALRSWREGRHAEAIEFFGEALRLSPGSADLLSDFATALAALRRAAEAVTLYEQALVISPSHFAAHYGIGNVLYSLGRFEAAESHYQAALALRPDFAAAHNNLANVLQALKRWDEAIAHYRQALALMPDSPEAHANLGNALQALGRRGEAVIHYRQALALKPDYVPAWNNLGNALRLLDRVAEGKRCYEEALALAPGHVEARHNLGNALKELGRLDEAFLAYDNVLSLSPTRTSVYYDLVDIRRIEAGDRHLTAMEALARDAGSLGDDARMHLHFALAKALADVGRHDDAFRHLLWGNALKRRAVPYKEGATLDRFVRTKAVFTPELMRGKAGSGDPSSLPVFIVGMPRSGSTLVEQILASHPAVHGAGEIGDLSAILHSAARPPAGDAVWNDLERIRDWTGAQLRGIGARYVAGLRARSGAERITDKTLSNYFHVGIIGLALPNARIIHARRDPLDTCLSCFSKLFAADAQGFSYELAELGRYYRAYDALMAHWRQVLPAQAMLEVQYENLVADLEPEARRIIAYCGLPWSDTCLAFYEAKRPVRTASASQVRQPAYQSSIGRWRSYADHLEPLIEALGFDASQPSHLALTSGGEREHNLL